MPSVEVAPVDLLSVGSPVVVASVPEDDEPDDVPGSAVVAPSVPPASLHSPRCAATSVPSRWQQPSASHE